MKFLPTRAPAAAPMTLTDKFGTFFKFNQQTNIRVDRDKVQQAERNLDDFTKTRCGRIFVQFVNFFVLIIIIFGFTLVGMAVFNRKHYHNQPDVSKQKKDENVVKNMFAMFGKH